ncbi:cupin domain-containing protein [Candidatus Gottesmanbacteria bacterium]|nr:cupin domain-containing protein [Candidatus Gottesmanbacteria bacterium]
MKVKKLPPKYNLKDIDRKLGEKYWSPIDVASMNGWVLQAAAVKGKFHWHTHDYDEFFLIYKGKVTIQTEKGNIELAEGEGYVVPKGIKHCPVAKKRAVFLLLEPKKL